MRLSTFFLLCLIFLVSGCTATTTKNTPNKTTLAANNAGTTVDVFKFTGTVQCQRGGGITRADMENQLTKAGIEVLASACGNDGKMHITMCGAPDGDLFIFSIPATQLENARALGFAPLSNLSSANKIPCQN